MNLLEQLRDAEIAGSAEHIYPEQPGNRKIAGSAGRMYPEGPGDTETAGSAGQMRLEQLEGFLHAASLDSRAAGLKFCQIIETFLIAELPDICLISGIPRHLIYNVRNALCPDAFAHCLNKADKGSNITVNKFPVIPVRTKGYSPGRMRAMERIP